MSNDKIVWIDLGEKCVELRSAKDYDSEVYIGGRGLATRIYWEEATPDANAFSPSSPLILMSGLAVGTGIKGATRMVIVGKSALKGWFCYGNLGGFFPALLRKAGFLGLVIRGVSEKPCYIFLCGDRIEIHEAQDLWGRNTQEVIKVLKKRFGPGTEVLTIGKAGENLVSFSTIVSSHQSSASGGLGAVMGSKKLKAIVVKKTPVNKLYTDRKLCLLNDYIYQVSNRIRLSIPPKIVATGKEGLIKVIGNGSCYGCNLKCIRGRYLYEGGFKGYRKCQAMEYYLPWLYGKEDEPLETLFLAPVLANDYGMCTFELEHIIDWLYLCYKEGALSEKEAGLPLSEIGRGFFLNRLLEALCERRGLGNILARGLENASEVLSSGPREIFERLMKPISKHVYIPVRDLDEARGHLVNMLLYQFEPRRHRPLLHQGFTLVAWQLHTNNPSISPISYEIYKKICEIFWGSELAADDSTYEGKGLAAVKIQNRIYAIDSLGLCSFAYPITYSLSTEDNVGDPDAEAKILSALKGISLEDAQILLEQCGSKTVELQRKILQKEGWELPDSDYPPRFHFEEPLPPNIIGHKFIIPGRNGEPVLPTGSTLDESGYRRMLQEYYDLRGWSGS